MSDGFETIMQSAAPNVATLARSAKALIQDVMPNVVEVPWPHQKNVGYGVGPKKMSEHFCYIGVLKDRINLGFFYGADLADPEKLLEGAGHALRHIKVKSEQQLQDPALRALVVAASTHLPKLKR